MLNEDNLKEVFLSLLKKDEDFKKSVISIIQGDLIANLNINIETSESEVVVHDPYGNEQQKTVIEEINIDSIKFRPFSISEKLVEDGYLMIFLNLFQSTFSSVISKTNKDLYRFLFEKSIKNILYHDIPTIESYSMYLEEKVKLINSDFSKFTEGSRSERKSFLLKCINNHL